MQEGEPQIHFAGKVPGAGLLKAISVGAAVGMGLGMLVRAAEAAARVGMAAEAMGKARKVLRFIGSF